MKVGRSVGQNREKNKHIKGAREGRAAKYERLVTWSLIVRQDISCHDPVEKQYYSCKTFDLICRRCGSTEPNEPVNEEMKRQYKLVNPVCRTCSEKGAKPVVPAPNTLTASAGKKKKKPWNQFCVKTKLHFDRLKLSSKTVRELLFNESFCFIHEKSLDEMLFSKKHSVCAPLHIKSHVYSARYNQMVKDV